MMPISLCFIVFVSFSQKIDAPVMWLSFDEINVNKKLHTQTVKDMITKRLYAIRGMYVAQKE